MAAAPRTGSGLPNVRLGCVAMRTTIVWPGPLREKKSSFPSGDQSGWKPFEIRFLAPVVGNGSTKSAKAAFLTMAYATHRPSGEKAALGDADNCPMSKGVGVLSPTPEIQRVKEDPFLSENRKRSLFGTQASGIWDAPDSGLVSRSAAPVPSARCQIDCEITFPVRLERDSLGVRRPDGVAISATKCELAH